MEDHPTMKNTPESSSIPTSNTAILAKQINLNNSQSQEFMDFLSTIPKEKGFCNSQTYQYQGFWYPLAVLKGTITFQQNFEAQDSDVLLVTVPKSGTTWLKALIFALLNRSVHPPNSQNHPLLEKNCHSLVPFLEFLQPSAYNSFFTTSPRVFACHTPLLTLPKSVKDDSTTCKIVYLCRDIKDNMISLWHFLNKLQDQYVPLEDVFSLYSRGISICGPVWEHILGYWKESLVRPHKLLFVKFEDMKKQPSVQLKRIANFLECPFSDEEENLGLVDQVLNLCSFDVMSNLEVNKTGKLDNQNVSNSIYFGTGETGGWNKYLTKDMAAKLDQITKEKFHGSGLSL